jgi:hypothetical protein
MKINVIKTVLIKTLLSSEELAFSLATKTMAPALLSSRNKVVTADSIITTFVYQAISEWKAKCRAADLTVSSEFSETTAQR